MDIGQLLEKFESKTVLVIGDVMIDSYIIGSKPGNDGIPIINSMRTEKRLGGAANVALNIQALGAIPILCSVVGDDHEGEVFGHLLDAQGMPNKGIIRSQNRKTTTKLRVLAGSNQLVRVDTEDTHPLIDLDRKALLNHINNLIKECDVVIFEDYDKGTIHSEIISETISIAQKKEIPVAVDPRHKNFFAYEGATLFKPYLDELETTMHTKLSTGREESLKELIEVLTKKTSAEKYLISLDDGDIFFHSKQLSGIFPTYHTGIADMSGVGNAIISIAALGLSLNLEDEVIVELANISASVVAKYSGVVPISKDHLLKEASESQILAKYH